MLRILAAVAAAVGVSRVACHCDSFPVCASLTDGRHHKLGV
jgi:hypothetical protein